MKYINFTYKSISKSDDLHISGYASVFGVIDSYNDIITKGAFSKTLSSKKSNFKFLWQHEQKKPIGKINKIFEDDHGLYIEATILSSTSKGKEAIELVKNKVLDSLSIGFNVIESEINTKGQRVITEIDLWEISLVTFPANEESKIAINEHITKNKLIDLNDFHITSEIANFIKTISSDLKQLNSKEAK